MNNAPFAGEANDVKRDERNREAKRSSEVKKLSRRWPADEGGIIGRYDYKNL